MANQSLYYKFKTANIVVKFIVINALVFLGVRLISFVIQTKPGILTKWFVLPDAFSELIVQPWAFFTYSFLHFDFFHVLFNMLWLHWFGQIVLNLFTPKRFLTLYLLGGFFGGLLFVLAYNLFPVFANSRGYLIGASGAVMAIMVFMATYAPNTEMRLFRFNIKLWHIAAFFVVLDLVRLPTSGNAGGLLAHIGGAIFGYVYARQLVKGNDIGIWFEKILDGTANLFKTRKAKPFQKVHRTKATRSGSIRSKEKDTKSDHQKKVDIILDKIGKSGYESLTKSEKDYLFKSGKND
jgi:membrane associated rhomboid family serine protease